jgi:hypothetical protein
VGDVFAAWVLLTSATLDEEKALDALTGGPHDRGLDAILVDDSQAGRLVWIVQGKLPKQVRNTYEPRSEVESFARLAHYLTVAEHEAEEFWADLRLNQYNAAERFAEARDRVSRRRYGVRFIYAALRNFDPYDIDEATQAVTNELPRGSIDFWNSEAVYRRLSDYVHDISPSIGMIELPVLEDHVTPITEAGVAAYSFSVQGSVLAELYDGIGDQLFARNIRWYMGLNPVNKDVESTALNEPERFWLYNNGVTFICDSVHFDLSARRRVARIDGGQIVNGQQTTRTLHGLRKKPAGRVPTERVRVPVRVIEIGSQDPQRRDDLVSGIVRATNWQTAVSMADLRANDVDQIELQRELYARGYVYKRKRGAAAEAPMPPRPRNYVATLTKEDLARAVAGVQAPGRALREGITPLFDKHYRSIFSHAPDYHLACYWLARKTADQVRGDAIRKSAKYYVHYGIWRDAKRFLSPRLARFVDACERRDDDTLDPLRRAVDAMFTVCARSFREHTAQQGGIVEPTAWFKRPDVNSLLLDTWNRYPQGKAQRRYASALKALEQALH